MQTAQGAQPGDEQMSCVQIQAELRQQQYSAPDPNKVAGSQVTTRQTVADVQRGEAMAAKMQAEDQSVVNAASAANRVTEAASMGMVSGRALESAEEGIEKHDDELKAQLMKKTTPNQQKQYSQIADFGSDAAGQLHAVQSSPGTADPARERQAMQGRMNSLACDSFGAKRSLLITATRCASPGAAAGAPRVEQESRQHDHALVVANHFNVRRALATLGSFEAPQGAGTVMMALLSRPEPKQYAATAVP